MAEGNNRTGRIAIDAQRRRKPTNLGNCIVSTNISAVLLFCMPHL